MSLSSMKNLVTSKAARQLLLVRKHSPTTLFVLGAVGVVGATVLACRATLKLSDTLHEHEDELNVIKDGPYNDSEMKREIRKQQIRLVLDITKSYALPVAIGTTSIAALTGSHVVLSKRNGTIMAAYAALDQAHKNYRTQVRDEYGADADRRFAMAESTKPAEVGEKMADGTIKTAKKIITSKDGKHKGSVYASLFDETTSRRWSREPGANIQTIMFQTAFANDMLRTRGHLFLNELYDLLGMPRTRPGAVVGWVCDPEKRAAGDNQIDLGIFRNDMEAGEAFAQGDELSVWLDPNVQGVILDLI